MARHPPRVHHKEGSTARGRPFICHRAWFQHHRVIVWRSNSIGVKFFTSLWRPFLARTGANSNDSENLVWPSLQDTRGTDRNFNEMFQHPFVKTSYHIGYFCPLNTDPWFDCYYDFVSFVQQWCHLHFFIFRLYIFPTLCSWFHFLCPEWAAALHTKSKLKNVLSSGCPPDFVPRKLFGSRDCFTGHCTWLLPSRLPADRRVLAWSRGFGGFCEDLADGRSVAPKSFRSRKEAAKACMAACVGMALHIVDQGGDQTLTKNGWGLANILSTTTIENIDFSFVERGFWFQKE